MAITRAPAARAIWTAKEPTPPEPPWMRIVSPGRTFRRRMTASHAVPPASGIAAASAQPIPAGLGATMSAGATVYSA